MGGACGKQKVAAKVPEVYEQPADAPDEAVGSIFASYSQNAGGHTDEDEPSPDLPVQPADAVSFPVPDEKDLIVVPPGNCQLGPAGFLALPLVARKVINHDSCLFTFDCPDNTKSLGQSTVASVLAKIMVEGEDAPVIRPYTPVSTNALLGKFELFVKIYPDGKMTQFMYNMKLGDTLEFKQVPVELKKRPSISFQSYHESADDEEEYAPAFSRTQYPFRGVNHLVMIVGGTGITPMLQALHAIIGTAKDKIKVAMLYGSRTQRDILGKELLDLWAKKFADQLEVIHVLSREVRA